MLHTHFAPTADLGSQYPCSPVSVEEQFTGILLVNCYLIRVQTLFGCEPNKDAILHLAMPCFQLIV